MELNVQEVNNDYPLGVRGLGGWLVFVQVGIYLTILLLLNQIYQYTLPVFSETWDMLTSSGFEYYHPLWAPLIIFEMVYNIAFLLFLAFILFNFYRKKVILPKLMIIFYCASLVVGIIDFVGLHQISMAINLEDGKAVRNILKSVITCAIWIPYFLKSDRVYNTFRK